MVLGVTGLNHIYGQEIIPFPDINESQLAVYNQSEMIDDHNYSFYTKAYQDALTKIDADIESLNKSIQNEIETENRIPLENHKKELLKKRSELLKEADLLEDLNKFYD